jgi:methylase of polypeptide subunit release factors
MTTDPAISHVTYGGTISVLYRPDLDGGGRTFGQDTVRYVAETLGRVRSVLEWCAGPGFIGFSLLANGLCDCLSLADVNVEAVRVASATVRENGLSDRVDVFQSDCFEQVPRRMFDLIVANPPHTPGGKFFPHWGPPVLYTDPGWSIHRRFYKSAASYLSDDGNILIQENSKFSSSGDFEEMIAAGGLNISSVSPSVRPYYFLHLKKDSCGSVPT